jgi:dihydroorotase
MSAATEGTDDVRHRRDVLVRGGRVVDHTGERRADVLVSGGRIAAVGDDVADAAARGHLLVDAGGCLVMPGLVDVHAHLREPGLEEAETIETGARAAALGGYTCVVAMPNTTPAVDSAGVAREVLDLGRRACCDVRTAAAITMGRRGEQLTPMAELAALGVTLFTDDGEGVQDARLMRRAMEYARGLGVTLAQHCEDAALAAGGHMHEGEVSARLGLPGIPAEAEELMVMRDIALAQLTGVKLHFQHLSTAGSVAIVRAAKSGGLAVTCEAAPHHFTLTDESCTSFDPVFKVNPPLRPESDVRAVRAGLGDGAIDCIATDHAPHAPETKEQPFDQAPPGMLGLQTALALALTQLDLAPTDLVALLSSRPAAIAGVADEHGGPIAAGRPAHLCVVDPGETWVVDPTDLASRSRNTPYAGMTLTGAVRHTLLGGEPVVLDGKAQR